LLPAWDTAAKTKARISAQTTTIQTAKEKAKPLQVHRQDKLFQCGSLLPEGKPMIHIPTENDGWKNSTNGRVIPHDQLQSYLKRYQFIETHCP
jgi:hypothetical protein